MLIEDAMWASRVPVFAIPFMIPTAASCAWEEPPVTVVLECKGSVTKYKNGILFRSDGGPMYYRIELRLSDAVVQFKIGDENYDLPERYDLKTSNSSYRLALPSNTTTMRQTIQIDRLNGDFTAWVVVNDIGYKYFGSCQKIDNAHKF